MPLYLTGGGDQDDFRHLDRYFLSQLPEESSILVLPFAMDVEEFDEALERAEDCFGNKVETFELCQDPDQVSLEHLNSFSAVFIEGGNTFQLIEAVRRSEFFGHLGAFLKQGGHIYADSAGAIVLGADVKTAFLGEDADEDQQKLQNYRGLGLVDSWSFHCHFEGEEEAQLEGLIYETGSPILALAEPCGVYIDDSKLKVFGVEPLHIYSFSGKRTIAVNEEIDLNQMI